MLVLLTSIFFVTAQLAERYKDIKILACHAPVITACYLHVMFNSWKLIISSSHVGFPTYLLGFCLGTDISESSAAPKATTQFHNGRKYKSPQILPANSPPQQLPPVWNEKRRKLSSSKPTPSERSSSSSSATDEPDQAVQSCKLIYLLCVVFVA